MHLKLTPAAREELGMVVREAWIRWAEQQPAPKKSWLLPYNQLSEEDKEADRQIGEAVFRYTMEGIEEFFSKRL